MLPTILRRLLFDFSPLCLVGLIFPTIPLCIPSTTASIIVEQRSFSRMFLLCVSAVTGLIPKILAISFVDFPFEDHHKHSFSRSVRFSFSGYPLFITARRN